MTKKIIYIGTSFFIAFVLIYLLIGKLNVNLHEILKRVKGIHYGWAWVILISTTINFYIVTFRWQYISERIENKQVPFSFYYLNVSLGAALGILLPQQIAFFAVRSLSLKFFKKIPFKKSSFSVLYDIAIGVFPVLIVAPASIFFLKSGCRVYDSAAWFLGLLLLGFFLMVFFVPKFLLFLFKLILSLRKEPPITGNESISRVLRKKTLIIVFLLSIFQNLNLAIRNYAVVLSVGMNVGLVKILFAYPIVFCAMLIGITPGNIGVAEWTWAGFLVLVDVNPVNAGEYAIFNRILIASAQVTILFLAILCLIMKRYFRCPFGKPA